jgi:ectoine hydroxylase
MYNENGFALVPELFSAAEINSLKGRLPAIFAGDGPWKVVEKDGASVRSVYGPHFTDALFNRLTRDKRILEPAERIIDDYVYIHQVKINFKAGFTGDAWEWHQDYIFWLKEDGILKSDLITAAVYLDEVTEFNGPMFFIPGSHKESMLDVEGDEAIPPEYEGRPRWISNLIADLKYSIPKETVARLIRSRGIVAPKGMPGSVLFFHPNVVHASPSNISPFDRIMALITYNSVNNRPVGAATRRPDFLCGREFSAVRPEPSAGLSAD